LQKELTGLSAKAKTLVKKRFLIILENWLPKPQKWCQKGFLEEKAWPDVGW
jgi:hypothetical protein